MLKFNKKVNLEEEDQKGNWKGIVHRERNNSRTLSFNAKTLSSASNALILTKSSSLKKELKLNERKFGERVTQY